MKDGSQLRLIDDDKIPFCFNNGLFLIHLSLSL